MIDKKYSRRADGIIEILPVKPKNIPVPISEEEQLGDDLPFLDNGQNNLFCIRDSFALCHRQAENLVRGIVAFEIRPESWTLIYTHTQELDGFSYIADDDGSILQEFDFYNIPIERIYTGFNEHIDTIMQSCIDYMQSRPDLPVYIVDAINQTVAELAQSSTIDFTIDIYIPPQLCDLTGERYFRPGGELYNAFDNPKYDTDFTPSRELKKFLYDIITYKLPDLGLGLSCDDFLREEHYSRQKDEQRLVVEEKIEELFKKFKKYSCPHAIKNRQAMRKSEIEFTPEKRKPSRPFIIPKHWHYD